MKLIVDIPDSLYKSTLILCTGRSVGKTFLNDMIVAIKRGIPLDKVKQEIMTCISEEAKSSLLPREQVIEIIDKCAEGEK